MWRLPSPPLRFSTLRFACGPGASSSSPTVSDLPLLLGPAPLCHFFYFIALLTPDIRFYVCPFVHRLSVGGLSPQGQAGVSVLWPVPEGRLPHSRCSLSTQWGEYPYITHLFPHISSHCPLCGLHSCPARGVVWPMSVITAGHRGEGMETSL